MIQYALHRRAGVDGRFVDAAGAGVEHRVQVLQETPAGGVHAGDLNVTVREVKHNFVPVLGDAGDIILADMKQYWTGLKSTGMRQDVSIHLWFDYDVTAFRFIMRLGGQCWFSAAISGRDTGTSTMSSFITLAART